MRDGGKRQEPVENQIKVGEIWEQWNETRTSVMNIIGWWVSGSDVKLG